MRFVIVTGMSGAGKSTTLKMMEDMGYFCVDNMPIPLMTKLTELLIVPNGEITKIALGLDIRSGQNLRALDQILDELEKTKIPLEILFLESNDDTLVKRYKETRRNHPLSKGGRIENGIAKERKKIAFLKERADYILDTSRMLTRELRSELNRIFAENKDTRICTLLCYLSDLNMEFRVMQTWYLMSDSFRIRIILMNFARRVAMTSRSGIT